ncbi:hypothetical protein C7477_11710 [Phyllobacterium leguminum]|uniref:Uncharacterized protein n=1 Tax=Phyllobacterium leguminum TaxID=314237 RepID=A0A318SY39_9HYPH|nr:hypothetical protein C7477_11710 [Phyllobacterium leguminum]
MLRWPRVSPSGRFGYGHVRRHADEATAGQGKPSSSADGYGRVPAIGFHQGAASADKPTEQSSSATNRLRPECRNNRRRAPTSLPPRERPGEARSRRGTMPPHQAASSTSTVSSVPRTSSRVPPRSDSTSSLVAIRVMPLVNCLLKSACCEELTTHITGSFLAGIGPAHCSSSANNSSLRRAKARCVALMPNGTRIARTNVPNHSNLVANVYIANVPAS